jgi:hypothetical protein
MIARVCGKHTELNQGISETVARSVATEGQRGMVRGSSENARFGFAVFFGLAAVIFAILAVIGTVRSYSLVPYYDMWDDDLDFYLKVHSGDWSAWWVLHYQHRIVLARLIFWIDFACFGGRGIFSLVATYLSIGMVGILFALIWRERSRGRHIYILFFIEAWIFSWSQRQNLTWAFQSQFILAQMLPLAALYFAHLSASRANKSTLYFVLATLCGVLAVGSMANGVLALPATAVFALIVGMRFRRVFFLITLSIVELVLYFQHFSFLKSPSMPAGTNAGTLLHLIRYIEYVLIYLGSPFVLLLDPAGSVPLAIRLGELLAAFLIILSSLAFFQTLRRADRATLTVALVVFIFYIIATAAITAAGRLEMGLKFALSSRYVTPALYGWAAALLLFWPAITKSNGSRNLWLAFFAVLLCVFMFPQQLQALAGQRGMLFQREVAALSLELQIEDVNQINVVHGAPLNDTDAVMRIAKQAQQQHLSVFGYPPIKDAHLLLGTTNKVRPPVECRGHWDSTDIIPNVPQYLRVRGWVFDSSSISAPGLVYLVDKTNKIMGLGFVGEPRGDVAQVDGKKAMYSGFKGYLWSGTKGQGISVVSPVQGCTLPAVTVRF